jgi:hypothetical protein
MDVPLGGSLAAPFKPHCIFPARLKAGVPNTERRGYSCAEKTASPSDEMHEFMAFFALTLFAESCVCGFPFETGQVECNPQARVERLWRTWIIQEFPRHLRAENRLAMTFAATVG